jgi:hypothetical protein
MIATLVASSDATALFGAVVIVVAAGLWLVDEFVWPLWRH